MRIATYNINSVRLRLERVLALLREQNLDILALQETKCADEHFPMEAFKQAGWEHSYCSGEKSYNGVALISRIPLSNVHPVAFINDHKRHLAGTLPNGTEIHTFYIPAGGDEPDPVINPKFKHKLDYVDAMHDYFKEHHHRDKPMITLGDFNIAPLEHDVWSHKQLVKVVSHTPIEVEKHTRMQRSIGWIDVAREFVPPEKKLYSWWSYRNRDWRKSNRGRRLDHIWVTAPLKEKVRSIDFLNDLRDGEKPSDHIPVIMELAV